ncbi:activator of 90 kDa heat shock protein ATPase homolog 1b isoform X1 [Carcharodon carcharias]|uniref:activator of 90 kDa heat shock protein ATPase homolog 1b isoform X1 n=1 Tax=Carcharodon carcharias TaxID=13397 RepID=UPI001B7E949F|nr:activator of 90 kDa heat shock protein ATPase homolog 1b isoform X1 [Carcharodon carcharias]
MAKWGQGDPRWIVEERADATNVNNWHWTERDASNWSIDKLKSLLLAVNVENEEGVCKVTEVSKIDGEASINNRKGKLIFFFEWNIQLSWIGTSKTGIKYKGTVEIPNLSDENDIDDIDVIVGLAKDEPDTKLLALMKNDGAKKIREALLNYIDTLKLEFTQGMILPTVNGVQKEPSQSKPKVELQAKIPTGQLPSQHTSVGVKIPTCKINLKDYFMTSPEELYRIFITQELIQAFTHAPAVVEATKGGKFRLLDGNVSGEFLELVSEQRIVMKWRYKSWPTEHYATIKLVFCSKNDGTELQVECKGVPVGEEDQTKSGWQRYYFEGIKQTFGYNVRLF